jgi:hypothetical protein
LHLQRSGYASTPRVRPNRQKVRHGFTALGNGETLTAAYLTQEVCQVGLGFISTDGQEWWHGIFLQSN